MGTKRKELLIKMERIVGSECYNARIQNWGPNGVFQGEGRDFRYPITFRDETGEKIKKKVINNSTPTELLMDGYYAFGANELHIVKSLDKILSLLEKEYGLQVEE